MNETTTVTDRATRMEDVSGSELEAVDGGFFFLVVAGAALVGSCAGSLAGSPARDTLRALRK